MLLAMFVLLITCSAKILEDTRWAQKQDGDVNKKPQQSKYVISVDAGGYVEFTA